MAPIYQETDQVIEVTPNVCEHLKPAQFHFGFSSTTITLMPILMVMVLKKGWSEVWRSWIDATVV